MLAVIAILAAILGVGRWVYDRYASRTVTITYYVGDLIRPAVGGGGTAGLNGLPAQALLLKASVTPDAWRWGTRSVTPFYLSQSLIVRHTEAGHLEVQAWLRRQRAVLQTSKQ